MSSGIHSFFTVGVATSCVALLAGCSQANGAAFSNSTATPVAATRVSLESTPLAAGVSSATATSTAASTAGTVGSAAAPTSGAPTSSSGPAASRTAKPGATPTAARLDPAVPLNPVPYRPPTASTGTPPWKGTCPKPSAIMMVKNKPKRVALTFDDGPSVKTTDAILKILAAKKVRATFFEQGVNAAAHPEILRREIAGGHIVANHSWNHPQLTILTDAAVRSQLTRTTAALAKATGQTICFMRPPYGATSARVRKVIFGTGLSQVLWTIDTVDWSKPGVNTIIARAVAGSTTKMQIILMHAQPSATGQTQTVRALPAIIDRLKAKGVTFVQVDGTPFPADVKH